MSSTKQEWNEYLFNMHNNATKKFRDSTEFELLNEKVQRMEEDCKINFQGADYHYLEAWLEAVACQDGEECSFIYRQAYKDCVALLKLLLILE